MKNWCSRVGKLILAASMCMGAISVPILANQPRATVSEPEDVYVDIIASGERSALFNDNWKFYRGDMDNAASPSLNDSSWESVDLPHDYSIDQAFTTSGEAESGFLPGGIGWYRKTFVVPQKYEDKQLMITFDGVYMNAEVYVNGEKLGSHPYGYTQFAFDITDAIVADGETENVIAVKVDNSIPSSRWYSGSGIYRDVTLTVTDEVHVGYNGVKVTSKDLAEQYAGDVDVNVEATVVNDSDAAVDVTVRSTLLDASGASAAVSQDTALNIEAGSEATAQLSMVVNKPHLWGIDDPYLYSVKTEVLVDGEVVDTYENDYGFRYYSFDSETGFSFNGQMMKLKGVCMHHDQGALGAVANRDAIERQVKMLKDMGCNAIRVTHNPAAFVLLDICNEYGMLVIDEAFDGWTEYKNGNYNDYTTHFEDTITADNQILDGETGMQWGEFDARAMIKRGINEPCIIMWSIGNEITEGTSSSTAHYADLAADIISWMLDEDDTRPLTIGDNQRDDGQMSSMLNNIQDQLVAVGGVNGMNYVSTDAQLDSLHAAHPEWTLYGSETASSIHSRGEYSTFDGKSDKVKLQMSEYNNDATRVGWGLSASDAWELVIQNDYNAGEFVWTGFDYIGEPTPWNSTGVGSVSGQGAKPKSSYFGIVDTAGFEKDIYYLYKSLWDEDSNVVHLMTNWNNDEIVKVNGQVQVDVYTNAHKIKLYLNDELVGTDTATTHRTDAGYTYQTFSNGEFYPTFYVNWRSGTLRAVAYDENDQVISEDVIEGNQSVTTNTDASYLRLTPEKTEIQADGSSLCYIEVDVMDSNDEIVAGADDRITFSIEGNGTIVGVDNGDPTDTDSYKGTSRKAFHGKALVIVQSTEEAGSFTLSASASGLTSASTSVTTSEPENSGEAYLESYRISRNYYVDIDEEPQLPQSVTVTYSDGSTDEVNVNWADYDRGQLAQPGTFTISGQLEGLDVTATVTVHVIGEIVAVENWSAATNAGVMPDLPSTLRGIYADGSYSEPFAVSWDMSEADFAQPGTVVINGSVEILGQTYETQASVRVEEAVAESVDIASASRDDAPVFSNGTLRNGVASDPSTTAISDSLLQLNDGITNDSEDTNARWTNWALRNEAEPVDTYVQLDWEGTYTISNIYLWHFTDSAASVLPGDSNVRFEYQDENGDWVEVESTHITQVPYTSGSTSYGLIRPVTTSALRIWLKAPRTGTCIGLTEVQVFDYHEAVTANTSAELSSITLDGTNITEYPGYAGYDEASRTYTVNVDGALPTVNATGADNAAVQVLPAYDNTVKILVRSEDGNTLNTTNVKFNVESEAVDKEALNAYLNSEAVQSALTNESSYTETSFAAFKSAYDTAAAILADDSASQDAVDQAYAALVSAFEGLEENAGTETDRSALNAAIAKAEALNEADYTSASWAALQEALNDAKNVAADADQETIDAAAEALNAAIEALEEVSEPDDPASDAAIQALRNMVDKANALGSDDAALNAAITAAQAVLDKDAPTSTEVVTALLDLSEAMQAANAGESVNALRADLEASIQFIKENILTNAGNIRPGKLQALTNAIQAAQSVLDDEGATADQLKAANEALTKAAQELWEIVTKAELEALIESANGYLDGDYTAESIAILQDAITNAQAVAINDDATTSEVTDAITNLANAIAGLENEAGVNKSALEYEIELVTEMIANLDDYVPSTVEGLADKLAAAQTVYDDANADQEAVDAAVSTLREARLNARTLADKSALDEALSLYSGYSENDFTPATWTAFYAAYQDAAAVYADAEATQKDVDAAVEALNTAAQALVEAPATQEPSADAQVTEKPSVSAGGAGTAANAAAGTAAALLVLGAGAAWMLKRRKDQTNA